MKTFLCLMLSLCLLGELQAKKKKFDVDFTVTSSEGCTFRIVGTVEIDIQIPISSSTVTGFNGSITLGGASGCPSGTFNVNFGMVSAGGTEGGFPPEDENTLNLILWNDIRMQQAIQEIINP